jgi:hypothetical protein
VVLPGVRNQTGMRVTVGPVSETDGRPETTL